MNLNDLFDQLGKAVGLPGLQTNEEGCARLVFDGRITVNLESDPSRRLLHLYAVLGIVPAEGRDRLLYGLLKANLFGSGTGGATLAIDSAREEIVLFQSVGMDDVDVPRLLGTLETFVDTTEFWMEKMDLKLTRLRQQGRRVVEQALPGASFIRA